jgi:hypothetical protein
VGTAVAEGADVAVGGSVAVGTLVPVNAGAWASAGPLGTGVLHAANRVENIRRAKKIAFGNGRRKIYSQI